MKKIKYLSVVFFLIILVGCGKQKETTKKTEESTVDTVVRSKKEEKNSTIVNNMLVGHSKISFNNTKYDILSQGKFKQDELWGTFRKENDTKTYIQIDAFDNLQKVYGELSGYTLDGVDWDKETPITIHGFKEEAEQKSKDKKVIMYKARTGDIIFSVAMFSTDPLTEKELSDFEEITKNISVENVSSQIAAESGE